jgi:hypothetical protein
MDMFEHMFCEIRGVENMMPSIDFILDKAKDAVYRHGIRGLVIDPYNEVDHQRPNNQTETEYVSRLLTQVCCPRAPCAPAVAGDPLWAARASFLTCSCFPDVAPNTPHHLWSDRLPPHGTPMVKPHRTGSSFVSEEGLCEKQRCVQIKKFAALNSVHVWLVAHPRQLQQWKGEPPTLYDIAGSAHFINKADVGLVVHRDFAHAIQTGGSGEPATATQTGSSKDPSASDPRRHSLEDDPFACRIIIRKVQLCRTSLSACVLRSLVPRAGPVRGRPWLHILRARRNNHWFVTTVCWG